MRGPIALTVVPVVGCSFAEQQPSLPESTFGEARHFERAPINAMYPKIAAGRRRVNDEVAARYIPLRALGRFTAIVTASVPHTLLSLRPGCCVKVFGMNGFFAATHCMCVGDRRCVVCGEFCCAHNPLGDRCSCLFLAQKNKISMGSITCSL